MSDNSNLNEFLEKLEELIAEGLVTVKTNPVSGERIYKISEDFDEKELENLDD